MEARIYLNKQLIDIYEKPVTRKLQVAQIGDISQRKSTFSYSVKIPKTSKNIAILDMLGVLGSTSRKPYENVVCDYVVNSIYLIYNGSAIIKKSGDDFTLNMIDGFRSISEALGSKKINELPLSDLDHVLNAQAVKDSFTNTDGYIYALADYGLGLTEAVKAEKVAPSVFVHTIFERIFTSNNISLVGDFFTDNEDYKTEVLTAGQGYTVENEEGAYVSKGESNPAAINHIGNKKFISETPLESSYFQIPIEQGFLQDVTSVDGDLLFNVANRYSLEMIVYSYTLQGLFTISAFVNGELISVREFTSSEAKNRIIYFGIQANVGDILSVKYRAKSSPEQEESPYYAEFFLNPYVNFRLMEGQSITPGLFLGDITQIDFVKDVMNRYGLISHPVKGATDQFRFKQIENILNDITTSEDWTEKISGKIKESYNSGYAQINKASYKYPNTIEVENNDGELIVDNYNSSKEKTLFNSALGIPDVSDFYIDVERLFYIPIWKQGEEVDNSSVVPKLMRIKSIDTDITIQLYEIAGTVEASENIPILYLNNINLQYYIDEYYDMFSLMLNDYREIDVNINLSVIDIYNIDFFKLKYLKQTGRYYYLNSVKNTAGKISSINMSEIVFKK